MSSFPVNDEIREPPGTALMPVSSLEELRRELKRFRPAEVLAYCRNLSLELGKDKHRPVEIDIPPELDRWGVRRTIRVAPYSVALMTRLTLVEGSPLAPGNLDQSGFKRLLRIISELYDPLPAPSLLLRTWDEQAWYQRDISHAIGRGLMWYREIPKTLTVPEVDLPASFETCTGMTVDDFFGLAFLIFSLASSPKDTPFQYFLTVRPRGLSDRARELLASEKVKQFLETATLDQTAFRERARALNPQTAGAGRYDFSPLIERPLVFISGSGYVAPIPDLLIWMVDEQPYWRLREAHQGKGRRQPFATFFGKQIFERYVGELLADRMPDARRLPEDGTQYAPGLFGPDWLVIQGAEGIAIETVLATVATSSNEGEELTKLTAMIERDVVQRASAMPRKIAALTNGRPDLGLNVVRRWHRLIVTKTAIPWISLTKPKLIDPGVAPDAIPYHVLSIEEFETLMAAEDNYSVMKLLNEAESNPAANADFRAFLSRVYRERKAPFQYGRLNVLQTDFFSQFINSGR